MSNPANTSGLKSADAVIMAMPGRLLGCIVLADGTNAATVTLYDHASAASGTVLAKYVVDATLVAESPALPPDGIICNNGIYADVTGTGAEFIVYYSPS